MKSPNLPHLSHCLTPAPILDRSWSGRLFRLARRCAVVWLLMVVLHFVSTLHAGTHEMLRVWGATSWSGTVTVSGGGVQLAAEKSDFQEDELDWERPLAVYTV
jgi:hypothetical protein